MNFPERFANKLYNPRDIEGNPNYEVFRAVDAVHDALVDEEGFVGVEPFGSTMKGYSDKDSDLDIRIYVDIGERMNFEDINDTEEIVRIGSEIHKRTEEIKEKARKALEDNGFDCDKLHILVFTVSEKENTKRIENGLSNDESDARVVGSLFKVVKGDEISELRDSAVNELNKLPETERLRQVELMAVALSESDLKSYNKIQQRTGQQQDYDGLLEDRVQLWKNRILGLLE